MILFNTQKNRTWSWVRARAWAGVLDSSSPKAWAKASALTRAEAWAKIK
jgi:hypothetical protein